MKAKEKFLNKLSIWIVVLTMSFLILPYILFGDNCIITIHDNLDLTPTFFGQSKYYGFFSLDVPSGVMENTSSAYWGWGGFTIQNVLYHVFPLFTAYTLIYVLHLLIGFFSMYWLQTIIFGKNHRWILISTSLMYAILPVIPMWSMAVAALPLSAIFIYKIYTTKKHQWFIYTFLLTFFLELNCNAFFICGLWLLVFIILSIRDKKINRRLLFGFFVFCMGVVLFNFKLFYMQFAIGEDLNRAHFAIDAQNVIVGVLKYFILGYYHAASLQFIIIWPLIIFVACYLVTRYFMNIKRFGNKMTVRYYMMHLPKSITICMYSIVVIFTFSLIAAMDEAYLLDDVKDLIKPLKGFSFVRLYTISRLIWYLILTVLLLYLLKSIKGGKRYFIIECIIIMQIGYIILNPILKYNDAIYSYALNLYPKLTKQIKSRPSWKQFYDVNLFNNIKKDINYNNEPVACVGFHPSVLLYNNFNTIDGYLAYYPYRDMLKFRRLIEPELDSVPKTKHYYDIWGGRRYLYCSELNFKPTIERIDTPVKLNINPKVWALDFGGNYILSRAPLSNADDLKLSFVGKYTHEKSIYNIFVYKTIK